MPEYYNLIITIIRHPLSFLLNALLRLKSLVFRFCYRKRFLSVRKFPSISLNSNSIIKIEGEESINRVRIISDADRIIKGEYSFFSKVFVENLIIPEWNKDYISIYEWQNVESEKIKVNPKEGVDIKNVWELNRLQFLPIVGLAYLLSSDKKYYLFVKDILLNWIKENPLYYGPNWMNAMEPAIRSVNIILTLSFCKNMLEEDEEFFANISNSLYQHGLFIHLNREIGITGIKSNHFLSDILGLLYIGLFFKNRSHGTKWINYSHREIEKAMTEQVYEEGINFEHSTSYHRFVLEIFIYAYLAIKENSLPLSEDFKVKMMKMFQFVEMYTRPDGKAVQAGDTDDGRIAILNNYFDWDRRDHGYLFDYIKYLDINGEILLNDKMANNSGFNDNGPDESEKICKMYEKPGIFIIKDHGNYLFAVAWNVGTNGIGNHQHNDILSFELALNGESFIVDPGTYNYTAYPAERNLFRSTQYHNTIRIDKQEINSYSSHKLFRMNNNSKPKILSCYENKEEVMFQAEHYGYNRLSNPVTCKRKFVYKKKSKQFELHDRIYGIGSHSFEIFFHLDQDVKPECDNNKVYMRKNNVTSCIEVSDAESKFEIEKGFISNSYLQKEPSTILKLSSNFESEIEIINKIYSINR